MLRPFAQQFFDANPELEPILQEYCDKSGIDICIAASGIATSVLDLYISLTGDAGKKKGFIHCMIENMKTPKCREFTTGYLKNFIVMLESEDEDGVISFFSDELVNHVSLEEAIKDLPLHL